ncbi:MAG: hypothetical protein H6640_03870 [Caldilineaceae bacterium]|nr:hypothetical protein [Caldilineaceae bacterium]
MDFIQHIAQAGGLACGQHDGMAGIMQLDEIGADLLDLAAKARAGSKRRASGVFALVALP